MVEDGRWVAIEEDGDKQNTHKNRIRKISSIR